MDAVADGDDAPRGLVAEYERTADDEIGDAPVLEVMRVRTAYPDAAHCHKDVLRAGPRDGSLPQLEPAGLAQDADPHGAGELTGSCRCHPDLPV